MNMLKDTQLFLKLKGTLNLLTGTPPENKQLSEDSPVLINLPALIGKRDAMYEKVIEELNVKDLLSMELQKRCEKYNEILLYLLTGFETGKQIASFSRFLDNTKHRKNSLDQYMLLLADTIQAAQTLCNHQVIFNAEKEIISEFIGKKATTEIQKEDIVFSESEKKILECANHLVEIAKDAIKNHRENLKRSMSKEDEVRYMKSFTGYRSMQINGFSNSSIKDIGHSQKNL